MVNGVLQVNFRVPALAAGAHQILCLPEIPSGRLWPHGRTAPPVRLARNSARSTPVPQEDSGAADLTPPDAKPGAGIHHPRFGLLLKERMDKLGIECQVRLREEYGGDRTPQMFRDMVAFFQKYFPK